MEENSSLVLGLDVSTKCIGVCLMEDDGSDYGKIIELTHINPIIPSNTSENEKLYLKKKVFQEFVEKYKDFNITHVIIEEPLMRSTNVYTVSTLLRFNGMISDCVYNTLGVAPEYVSSYDARKYAFPELMSVRKYDKNGKPYIKSKIISEIKNGSLVLFGSYPWSIDKKLIIQDLVSDIFPDINWIYDKNGELKKENYDACDSYVCVLAYLHKKRYGELKFTTKIVNESNDESGKTSIEYELKYWDKELHRTVYL